MKLQTKVILFMELLAVIPLFSEAKNPESSKQALWQFENYGKRAEGSAEIESDEMIISTRNTRQAFFESDEYSFVFQKQPFPYDDCSRTAISVTIDHVPAGSAGIMMRSNENTNAANVHLEASSTGDLFLFFRSTDRSATAYRRVGSCSFPVEIRLTRQGNIFTGFYKNADNVWVKGPTVTAYVGDSQLIGFYACSGNDSQIGYEVETDRSMNVSFRDWDISYEENYIPAETDFTDDEPIKKGTLLRENFADGSLSNTPASIVNPVWDGIRYAELPRNKNGHRYWRKRGDGIFYLGDKKWADYEVAIDLSFAENAPETCEFTVQTRYQHVAVYEKMLKYYGITLRNGDELILNKYEAGGNSVKQLQKVGIPSYRDEKQHQIRIRMLDKTYEVLWDGKSVIRGTDDNFPITYGNIALKFTDADINIYRIEVLEIEDPINGSYDNYLMDYYETPLPPYMEKYGYEIKK